MMPLDVDHRSHGLASNVDTNVFNVTCTCHIQYIPEFIHQLPLFCDILVSAPICHVFLSCPQKRGSLLVSLDPVENIDFNFDDINRLYSQYRHIIYVFMQRNSLATNFT